MIDDINPLPFRIILSAPFPVLWMNQMDATILVGFPCGLSPVEIFIPLDLRLF